MSSLPDETQHVTDFAQVIRCMSNHGDGAADIYQESRIERVCEVLYLDCVSHHCVTFAYALHIIEHLFLIVNSLFFRLSFTCLLGEWWVYWLYSLYDQ